MNYIKFTFFCALFWNYNVVTPVYSARILGIVPIPSYSHQIVFHSLWRELSLRGHQVTVLTTDPMKNSTLTNLTEIDLHSSYKMWSKINVNELAKKSTIELFQIIVEIGYKLLDEQLQHPKVQTLLKNETEHFDLLIAENQFIAMLAFSARFKCPLIQMTSLDAQGLNYHLMGNPSHPVLNPDFILPFWGKLTFLERVISTALTVFVRFYTFFWFIPTQELLIKKHFGDNYPSIEELLNNTSMMFVNTDTILNQVRPLVPAIVQIGGGTHLNPPQPIPEDIKKHLDNATQGFIYFSLGSNIKSKQLSEKTRNVLLQTFAELPYLILWKFEEDLIEKPNNVIISKWFLQQDILRHPNIKVFITQGGLQSLEEAIYSHVPIIGMPFIADQECNIKKIVTKGLGVFVDYKTIDKISFKTTILEVINNPNYRNKVIELAELSKDQPMTGLERAVWWTEYVLRHKGAKHLRSPAMDLPDYQYFLLDVIAFCLLILLVVTFLIVMLVKAVYRVVKYFKTTKKIKVL